MCFIFVYVHMYECPHLIPVVHSTSSVPGSSPKTFLSHDVLTWKIGLISVIGSSIVAKKKWKKIVCRVLCYPGCQAIFRQISLPIINDDYYYTSYKNKILFLHMSDRLKEIYVKLLQMKIHIHSSAEYSFI